MEACLISDVNSVDYAMTLFVWCTLKARFENSEIFLKDNMQRILSGPDNPRIFEFIHTVLNSYVFSVS